MARACLHGRTSKLLRGSTSSWQLARNSFIEHPHHLFFIYSKPEVIHIPTPLRSPGEEQGGSASSTPTSFPCTSEHPNSPVS